MDKKIDLGLLINRLTIGILMLLHGLAKLSHGVEGIGGLLASKGLPEFLAYGVYVGEVLAPLAIIVGFRTRLAAVVLFINMLVITFMAHANDIFALSEHGGWKLELVGFYLFGSVVLFFTGSGKYALSHKNQWD